MVRLKSRYLLCEVNTTKRSELLLLDDRSVAAAVRAAVTRMHGDYGSALCSIRFSGTIRTCQKYLIRYNAQQLHRMLSKCENEKEKDEVRQAILNCCLPGGIKEEFEDDLESEEDEEE